MDVLIMESLLEMCSMETVLVPVLLDTPDQTASSVQEEQISNNVKMVELPKEQQANVHVHALPNSLEATVNNQLSAQPD